MIVNNISKILNKNFYVIIIGSGPAGISTALQLEKKKINSLIIEAGSLEYNSETHNYLKGEVIGDNSNDLEVTRVRKFGGTSSIWGGNCNPMLDYDFKNWPIKKKDLDQYSEEANEILNLKEKFYNESFNNNLNIYNLAWSNVKFGEKYLEKIKNSKNIYLSLDTSFINFTNESKNIRSVICKKNNQKFEIFGKNFILSCGGIENSRLLLWSSVSNEELIDPKMPIGKYYMNHPYHTIGEGIVDTNNFFSFLKSSKINNKPILTCNKNIYISAKKNFLENNKISNSGLYIEFRDINENNNLFKQLRCIAPKFIKNLYDQIKIKKFYEISIATLQEQEPYDYNYIELSDKKDPNNIPLIKVFWKKSKFERKSARLITEELSNIFLNEEIGRLSLEEYLYKDDISYEVTAGNHQLGGTRMGLNASDSVVDKNLKVHKVNNLFINGSSIFRTGGHCHPTYTIVQLALRLGDHLSKVYNIS